MLELYYKLKAEVDAGPGSPYLSHRYYWASMHLQAVRSYLSCWRAVE